MTWCRCVWGLRRSHEKRSTAKSSEVRRNMNNKTRAPTAKFGFLRIVCRFHDIAPRRVPDLYRGTECAATPMGFDELNCSTNLVDHIQNGLHNLFREFLKLISFVVVGFCAMVGLTFRLLLCGKARFPDQNCDNERHLLRLCYFIGPKCKVTCLTLHRW